MFSVLVRQPSSMCGGSVKSSTIFLSVFDTLELWLCSSLVGDVVRL